MRKPNSKTSPTAAHGALTASPATIDPLKLYTPTEAANALALGRTKLMNLIRTGRLQVRMLDGRIRIAHEDLAAFRAALPVGYAKGVCNALFAARDGK